MGRQHGASVLLTALATCAAHPPPTTVHREPMESWHTFKFAAYHPLQDAPEQQLQLAAPPDAAPQSMTTAAGVLVSRDSGATWKAMGDIEVRQHGGLAVFAPAQPQLAECMPCAGAAAAHALLLPARPLLCPPAGRQDLAGQPGAGGGQQGAAHHAVPHLRGCAAASSAACMHLAGSWRMGWRLPFWARCPAGQPSPPPWCPAGKAYISMSKDKGATWSRPWANSLPNPNSQVRRQQLQQWPAVDSTEGRTCARTRLAGTVTCTVTLTHPPTPVPRSFPR